MKALKLIGTILFAFVVACSSDPENDGDNGGASGSGGANNKGGSTNSGGSAGKSSGGSTATGGTGGQSTGGNSQSGGTAGTATGGSAGSGGSAGETNGGSGGNFSGDVAACLKDAVPHATMDTEVATFDGEGISVGLVRSIDPDRIGTSGSRIWNGERFALVRGAESYCIKDVAALLWNNTYHNFEDTFEIQASGQTLVFSWGRINYDTPTDWSVLAKKNGSVLWGPVPLNLTSCSNIKKSENCTEKYKNE